MKKLFILSVILAFGINMTAQESDKEAIKKTSLDSICRWSSKQR